MILWEPMKIESLQIFVIEMPNSFRSVKLKKQLKSFGLKFEVIKAIVGKNLSPEELSTSVDLNACKVRLGYPIGKELIGSGLSHQAIYKESLREKVDWALIFEEDAQLVSKSFFIEDLNLLINNKDLLSTPKIIQLFSRGSRIAKKYPFETLITTQLFEFYPRLVGSGAPAYLINKSALKLFKGSTKLNGAPDWPPWTLPVNFLAVFPWPVHETGSNSTVPQHWQSRFSYWNRRIQIIFFIYYIRNFKVYGQFRNFFKEEWLPFVLYLCWKLKGSKYLENTAGLQIF